MAGMEVQISTETRAALKADLTLRCVLRAKFRHDRSRRSADVIPWAQSRVVRLSSAVIQEVGQQTAGFSCDQRLTTEISESFHLKRPIHLITQKGSGYIMRRDKRADARVAEQYLDMSSIDKGPRAFFSDLKHPPFYDKNGRRMENWEEVMADSPEGSEPEEEDKSDNNIKGSEQDKLAKDSDLK
ncbi:hypothetical protein NUU61_004275 [Penicillium alfredii]|uniref:Uncharacterized protein n=1 Tax=Penicillium alfredii TaxID=1506179 RepID=A0A9W9FKT8_9EURO|nr:uncharacterized protein NUU61_004275 [Penicillium alfredii]KAJ5102053.1 hypothetical protein NUU61_004275 [Penicillium alfredii]